MGRDETWTWPIVLDRKSSSSFIMKYAMAAAPLNAATPTTLAATPTAAHLLLDMLGQINVKLYFSNSICMVHLLNSNSGMFWKKIFQLLRLSWVLSLSDSWHEFVNNVISFEFKNRYLVKFDCFCEILFIFTVFSSKTTVLIWQVFTELRSFFRKNVI